MATRTYDVKLTANSNVSDSYTGYSIVSTASTPAKGIITRISGVDVYVRNTSNTNFSVGDTIKVREDTLSGSYQNPETTPNFTPRSKTGTTDLVTRTISSISHNKFLTEARAAHMSGIVRFISVYYPGEWYTDDSDQPNNGQAWPHLFPMHFCTHGFSEDNNPQAFPVEYNGREYLPLPIDLDDISEDSDGKINTFSMSIFNADNIVNAIINNPFIAGYSSAGISITVDGETVTGIDARTVPGNSSYNPAIVSYYGKTNATIDKYQNDQLGATWTSVKEDSRHLIGAVVQITSTFQRFLKYWPEYSMVTNRVTNGRNINVRDATVYRIGDRVTSNNHSSSAVITDIQNNFEITVDSNMTVSPGDRLYIENPDADEASSVTDVFKIKKLQGVKREIATFELVSFLQYFTRIVPRERIMRNVCRFKYKDARCGYRGPGNYIIRGTANRRANPKAVTIDNEETTDLTKDQCAKTLEACQLRNNDPNYGGFISVR